MFLWVTCKEHPLCVSRMPDRENNSSESSPSHSSEGSLPLSAQARRERDHKHLDDITAAKLPPLHHSPAQLLTLEESTVLLKEQTKKQQVSLAKSLTRHWDWGVASGMGGTLNLDQQNPVWVTDASIHLSIYLASQLARGEIIFFSFICPVAGVLQVFYIMQEKTTK